MMCGEWSACGHYENDGCSGGEILIAVGAQLYTADYWGNGEWDSSEAMLLVADDTGTPVVQPHNLRLLTSLAGSETAELADLAFSMLQTGWWLGLDDDTDAQSVDVAQDFATRYEAGDPTMSEGFIRSYGNELAGELRLMRGWCIHK